MNKCIILVGVGGQGTITTSTILSKGLIEAGFDVKMSEIHGMSQRGGTVVTQIKYGEKVYSPIIGDGEADIIVSFEKLEALRALPFLKEGGTIVTDVREINPMPVLTGEAEYPHEAIEQLKEVVPNVIVVEAAKVLKEMYNYTFDGDDQLSELNAGISELIDENRQLRRRIKDLKNAQDES